MSTKETLKNASLKATPSRIALLNALRKGEGPMTVEELHNDINATDLVTVYRGLQSFIEHGLAREVHLKNGPTRYESAEGTHHHHVVCTQCGLIDELPGCDFSAAETLALSKSTHFATISEHTLEFFGSCHTCSRVV